MSDKPRKCPKPGRSSPVEQKNRAEIKKAVPQTTSAAETEDPRGKFLFFLGKKVRLVKREHNELPPSLEYTPDGQQVHFLRHACELEIETVPPNRFVRGMAYYILKAAIQELPSGKLSIPEWATPYEIKAGFVIDVYGAQEPQALWQWSRANRYPIKYPYRLPITQFSAQ
ncbi:MAG: hypothetical protein RBT78_04100 [Kiritimatiellia bacterium]|nr:hypothetical protein [Kiritimatiellia bacterium]